VSVPRVTIVVLNRNGAGDVRECLESVLQNTYPDFDVILVDNASEDGSVETVKSWASGRSEVESRLISSAGRPKPVSFREIDPDSPGQPEGGEQPFLTIISSKANLGFAGGHNLGIAVALKRSARYVLLMNSDIVVDRDFLRPLVERIQSPGVGAVGPVVLDYAREDIIWQAGGKVYPDRGWAQRRHAGRPLSDLGAEHSQVSYLPGCALLIDTAVLEAVGLLDTDYFLYFEDTDWLTRVRSLGWKVVLVPASKVWHKETYFGALAKLTYGPYYFARNRLIFTRKNYPRYLPTALIWSLRHGILDNILRRRWSSLAMSLLGMWDFFTAKTGRRDTLSHGTDTMPNMLIYSGDYKPQPGGIAEHAYKVACHLRKAGASVAVLAPRWGDCREFDRNQPFPTYRVARLPGLDWLLHFFTVFRIILKHRISIVYVATAHPCALVCRLVRLLISFDFTVTIHGHEVVYSAAGSRQKAKAALKPLQIGAIASADKVFAVSEFTRRSLVDAGVAERKVATIYNGVDLEDFDGAGEGREIVEKLGLAGKRIILTVARLDIHKGHDVVIKALPSVLKEVPDAVYVIVGEGEMSLSLHELTCTYDVRDRVVFTGLLPREDVLALLKGCDVFVMVSRIEGSSAEGFGIVFLEAGALSKPVVGGREGGIPDAVEDGVSGLLVDPENPGAVATAITRILLDPELASSLGRQGRARVEARFTWDAVIKRIIDGLNSSSPTA
jgi:glycosyltransferase involved in cell wall biosynthesis/GT2 family glycosyltransferase